MAQTTHTRPMHHCIGIPHTPSGAKKAFHQPPWCRCSADAAAATHTFGNTAATHHLKRVAEAIQQAKLVCLHARLDVERFGDTGWTWLEAARRCRSRNTP